MGVWRTAAVLAAAGLVCACQSMPDQKRGTVQRQGTLMEAAQTPLEDLNVRKVKIPEVLQRAVANPYDTRGVGDCRGIAAEIRRLDDALGPDTDEPPPPDTRTETERRTHSAAVIVAREGIASAVPFRGWIRQLSGAARRQREVQDAIVKGGARRGYLKGIGMRLNCAPPAAPSWFRPVRASAPAAPRAAQPRRR